MSKILGQDKSDAVKAVFVAHNDTSLGGCSNVSAVRAVLDENFHDALLVVDGAAALEARDFHMDAWEVDVVVATRPKTVMAPDGLTVLGVSAKARPMLRFAAE